MPRGARIGPAGLLSMTLLSCVLSLPLLAHDDDDRDGNHGHPHDNRPRIVPADARNPYGKSFEEWTAAWWQWAVQVPVTLNPFRDPTGELASHGQTGPVWFLAGNNGGTSVRHATIPDGKALFFPIMNLGWFQFATDPPVTPECIADNYSCIRDPIKGVQDNPRLLKCNIDGYPVHGLSDRRYFSVPFDLEMPDHNFVDQPAGIFTPNVDDGYYVMVRPLSRGAHVVHFEAINGSGEFVLDVTYHLTVAPSADVFPAQSHPFGRSYGEWAAKWWQWAMSIPTDGHHPGQAVDDGVYVMVPPLAPGRHTIHFGCFLSEFQFAQNITYHITVPSRHDR